jgi:hypothetical protein
VGADVQRLGEDLAGDWLHQIERALLTGAESEACDRTAEGDGDVGPDSPPANEDAE